MAPWGTTDMADALPEVAEAENPVETTEQLPTKTPQEHGWVQKQGYDYAQYNKTNKEIAEGLATGEENGEEPVQTAEEETAAVGGLRPGEWASNAAVYEFPHGEEGDVGPRFEMLEKQLFGSDLHVKSGIDFKK